MTQIAENLLFIRKKIRDLEKRYERIPNAVNLLAVSKTHSVEYIQQAIQANQLAFGENYVNEAIPKIEVLQSEKIEWHFIGNIQANKTRLIAENFSWVHSVDRLNIVERLNKQRPNHLPPLNICIQVNIDDDANKSGISADELPAFAEKIKAFSHLHFRGLMTIPKAYPTFELQRTVFRKLRLAFESLQKQGFDIDTLSMGMSQDFEAAIAEGSTLIRLGTAIFGARK